MFPTLRLKLILAFIAASFVTVALMGLGSFFLMRQAQINAERQRIGQLVLPTAYEVDSLVRQRASFPDIEKYLVQRAEDWHVRFLLLDQSAHIVVDTQNDLVGQTFDANANRRLSFKDQRYTGGFNFTNYEMGPQKQTVFAPSGMTISAPTQVERQYSLLMSVPEGNITGAWKQLLPRLGAPALAALLVAGLIGYLLARSIARPVARVTHASEAMAQGQYAQQLQVKGHDEISRLAASFNTMSVQVSRSDRMMRDLLANVAHELKTPLTSIQGFSQALIEGVTRTPEEQARAARIINDESDRMRRLVDDLLYLSQLESGQLRMEMGLLPIPALLQNAAERITWQLRESDRRFSLSIAPELQCLEGDERRLEQVLANLLDNAAYHTPAGGAITMSAERAGNDLLITVHNSGSYIPPEQLPRIFERFYRADPARAGEGRHGGLGLSIASEIVTAHHGRIEASSDPETGTAFRVYLPLPTEQCVPAPVKAGGLSGRFARPFFSPATGTNGAGAQPQPATSSAGRGNGPADSS